MGSIECMEVIKTSLTDENSNSSHKETIAILDKMQLIEKSSKTVIWRGLNIIQLNSI